MCQGWVRRSDEIVLEAFDNWHRELLRFAERKVGDEAVADDIVQDAFIALWQAPYVRDPRLFLFHVTRKRTIDVIRRRAKRPELLERLAIACGLSGRKDSPDAAIENGALDLSMIVYRLSTSDREALDLRYRYAFTVPEIADITMSTESAVRKRLERAAHRLRELARQARLFPDDPEQPTPGPLSSL